MTVKIVQEVDLDKVSIVVNQQNQIATAAVEDITSLFRDGIDGFMPQAEDCYYRAADGAIFSGKKITGFYKYTSNNLFFNGNLSMSGKVSNAAYIEEDGLRKLKFDVTVKAVGNADVRGILKFNEAPHVDDPKVKAIKDFLLGLQNGSYQEPSRVDNFTAPRYLVINSFGRDAISLDYEPEVTFVSADVVNTEEEFSVVQHYTMKVVVTKELDASKMLSSLKQNREINVGMIFYNMLSGYIPVLAAFFQYHPQYDYYFSDTVEHSPILGVPAKEDICQSIRISLYSDSVEWTE